MIHAPILRERFITRLVSQAGLDSVMQMLTLLLQKLCTAALKNREKNALDGREEHGFHIHLLLPNSFSLKANWLVYVFGMTLKICKSNLSMVWGGKGERVLKYTKQPLYHRDFLEKRQAGHLEMQTQSVERPAVYFHA